MNRKQIAALFCALVFICALAAAPSSLSAAPVSQAATPQPAVLYVLRVYLNSPQDTARLTQGPWDVLEARGKDYLLVQGNDATISALQTAGYRVQIDHLVSTFFTRAPSTYDSGYHTVAEHYQHMDDVATLHPTLALTVTYGVSWQRFITPTAGYDLKAICITHRQAGDCALNPNSSKPRFFLMAAIHARELTTGELAWRWIDYLVNNDGIDPNVTALLEYNELWVAPLANPDGRAVVDAGGDAPYMQRKNMDNALGLGDCPYPPSDWSYIYSQPGVDLNRNASFKWGGEGASNAPCDQTYMGTGPKSEPEEQALEALMANLFHQQRGSTITDTAPLTTTGIMLTLHSYANLVLLPWGWVSCTYQAPCPPDLRAPNDVPLRALAFHMSYYNGYETGQPSEALYAASGTSDDWAYGKLGIPGFTFEVGDSGGGCGDFAPPYSCQDSLFWPQNMGAFIYAAQVARQPYALGLGPVTQMPTTTLAVPVSATATFTATIAGDLYGNSGFDRPTPKTIQAARFTIDTPPWISGSVPVSMSVGGPAATTQVVTGTLPDNLPPGIHWLFVQGQDTQGNWGPASARWVRVLVLPYTLRLVVVYRN